MKILAGYIYNCKRFLFITFMIWKVLLHQELIFLKVVPTADFQIRYGVSSCVLNGHHINLLFHRSWSRNLNVVTYKDISEDINQRIGTHCFERSKWLSYVLQRITFCLAYFMIFILGQNEETTFLSFFYHLRSSIRWFLFPRDTRFEYIFRVRCLRYLFISCTCSSSYILLYRAQNALQPFSVIRNFRFAFLFLRLRRHWINSHYV